jgi:hypothetical protein
MKQIREYLLTILDVGFEKSWRYCQDGMCNMNFINYHSLILFFLLVINDLGCKVERFSKEKYAVVTVQAGMVLRDQPSVNSDRLDVLRKGTVVYITGETKEADRVKNIGTDKWYSIRTISNQTGYGFGKLIQFIPKDQAELFIQRDKANFETSLRKGILEEAASHIHKTGLFPYDKIADIRITSVLEPHSSSAYTVDVQAFMIGDLIGVDRYRVDLRVYMEMEIDRDHLSSSLYKFQQVDVLESTRVEGIEPGQIISLLNKVL